MSGLFSNNGIVPSPLLKRPSAVATPMHRGSMERADGAHGGAETQVIMDGSQNLGTVRPAGAMSPASSGTSPRSASKWGLGGARGTSSACAGGGSNETTQPISEQVMPSNRRSLRCARVARALHASSRRAPPAKLATAGRLTRRAFAVRARPLAPRRRSNEDLR